MSIPAKRAWRDGRAHRRMGLTNSCSTRLKRPILSVLKLVADIATNYHALPFGGLVPAATVGRLFHQRLESMEQSSMHRELLCKRVIAWANGRRSFAQVKKFTCSHSTPKFRESVLPQATAHRSSQASRFAFV